MPPGWRLAAFGECAVLVRDTVSPTNLGDMPYVGLEHVGEGTLSLASSGVATEVTSTKSRFTSNDVLFGKLRPYLRKVARARFDGICSTDIWVVRPAEGVDAGYLFHVMASQKFVDAATRGSEGTKMPRAKWDLVSRIRLSLPPLEEQQCITAVLDSIDEAIEYTGKVIAAMERLKDSLLHELLTRGIPGWHEEWKEVRGLGTVPDYWNVVRLEDVADVVGGSTPSRRHAEYWGDGILWATPSELTELTGRYLADTRESITLDGMKAAGLRILPPGSILLTTRATIGATAMNSHPVTTNQGFQNLIGNGKANSLWLYYCISSKRKELEKRGSGSTFREVSRDSVRSLPILLPPLTEQRVIAATLDSIDTALEQVRKERVVLQSLKASTADALLTGRLRNVAVRSVPDDS